MNKYMLIGMLMMNSIMIEVSPAQQGPRNNNNQERAGGATICHYLLVLRQLTNLTSVAITCLCLGAKMATITLTYLLYPTIRLPYST
jgi:hypothetical protein